MQKINETKTVYRTFCTKVPKEHQMGLKNKIKLVCRK